MNFDEFQMADIENVKQGVKACWSEYFCHKCCDCPYKPDRDDNECVERLGADVLKVLEIQQTEIDRLIAEKWKGEIKVGDEVASINHATGKLNLLNTFVVTEIGEDFIGGINSKGQTHFHDEPRVFNIWAKTGKHIDILRAFEPVETASQKEGEEE